jgi:hypothetical protein
MLGWIKYLQKVRVETDALKRNKDLAPTRTPRSRTHHRCRAAMVPLRHFFFVASTMTSAIKSAFSRKSSISSQAFSWVMGRRSWNRHTTFS